MSLFGECHPIPRNYCAFSTADALQPFARVEALLLKHDSFESFDSQLCEQLHMEDDFPPNCKSSTTRPEVIKLPKMLKTRSLG
jgi:hypothetical protein